MPSKIKVGTQTELLQEDVMVQVTGCWECYGLSLVAGVSKEMICSAKWHSCKVKLKSCKTKWKGLGALGRLKWRQTGGANLCPACSGNGSTCHITPRNEWPLYNL